MKQKKFATITNVQAGLQFVNVELDGECAGGWFWNHTEESPIPVLRIGMDTPWPKAIATLLHETLEFLYFVRGHRYVCDSNLSESSSQYEFFFNHEQFSDICVRCSDLIGKVLPEMDRLYAKWGLYEKYHGKDK